MSQHFVPKGSQLLPRPHSTTCLKEKRVGMVLVCTCVRLSLDISTFGRGVVTRLTYSVAQGWLRHFVGFMTGRYIRVYSTAQMQ